MAVLGRIPCDCGIVRSVSTIGQPTVHARIHWNMCGVKGHDSGSSRKRQGLVYATGVAQSHRSRSFFQMGLGKVRLVMTYTAATTRRKLYPQTRVVSHKRRSEVVEHQADLSWHSTADTRFAMWDSPRRTKVYSASVVNNAELGILRGPPPLQLSWVPWWARFKRSRLPLSRSTTGPWRSQPTRRQRHSLCSRTIPSGDASKVYPFAST